MCDCCCLFVVVVFVCFFCCCYLILLLLDLSSISLFIDPGRQLGTSYKKQIIMGNTSSDKFIPAKSTRLELMEGGGGDIDKVRIEVRTVDTPKPKSGQVLIEVKVRYDARSNF